VWWSGRGRGRGFGLGQGFGRGLGYDPGMGIRGSYGIGPGIGMGRGFGPNPYWSCRWFPWLPRGWWRFPSFSGYGVPYSSLYPQTTGFPSFPQYPPVWPSSPMVQPGIMQPTQEREMLEQNLKVLEDQLDEIRRRLSELETQE